MDRQATPPKRVTSKKRALRRSQVICTLTSPHTYKKEMGRSLRNFAPYTIRISTSRYFSFFASQDSLRCLNTPVLGCLRLFKKVLIKLQSNLIKRNLWVASRRAEQSSVVGVNRVNYSMVSGIKIQKEYHFKKYCKTNIIILKCGQPPTNDYSISWTS